MTVDLEDGQQPSVLRAAAANKGLVVLITGAISLGALIYSVSRPPIHEAVTTVVLDVGSPAAEVGIVNSGDQNRLVRNQLQIFRSASVARQAVELTRNAGFEIDLAELLRGAAFTNLTETDVITITFSHEDRETAEAVVASLVEGYRIVRAEQNRSDIEAAIRRLESAEGVLMGQLNDLNEAISALRLPRGLSNQIAALLDQISAVSADASGATGEEKEILLSDLGALEAQLRALRIALDVEAEDPAIASLLNQRENVVQQLADLAGRKTEVEIGAEALDTGLGFVADPSSSSSGETASRLFTLVAGTALGLLVSLGLAFYLFQRRRVFSGRHEPQRLLGIAYLADVPAFSEDSDLPVRDSPRSPEAESFRFIATNLDLALKRLEARSVLVVSGGVGHGKSTVVANTAIASARSGRRVLVLDADFGNQAVTQLLVGQVSRRPGLTELVSGEIDIDEAVTSVKVSNRSSIDLLSRGRGQAVATEVFSNRNLGDLMGRVTDGYELILIDGPPLMQVAYASSLASLSESILVVIPAMSEVRAAIELNERLKFMDIPVVGYVYNKSVLRPEMAESGGSMKDVLGDLGMVEAIPPRSQR
jgi:capsular exopolysaccharide synthesis family protein